MCQAIQGRCQLPATSQLSSSRRTSTSSSSSSSSSTTSSSSSTSKRSIRRSQMEREYSNLKHLLPTMNTRPAVSKVQLINEAVRYINSLQDQVIRKLSEQSACSPNSCPPANLLPQLLLLQLQPQSNNNVSMATCNSLPVTSSSSVSTTKKSKNTRVLKPSQQTNSSAFPVTKKARYSSE